MLTALVLSGLGWLGWVFLGSLRATEAVVQSHQLEISLESLAPGQSLGVEWSGHEVFVLRRTKEQVDWLRAYTPPELSDSAKIEEWSPGLRNPFRSFDPEILVVMVWKSDSKWALMENPRTGYLCDDFRYSPQAIRIAGQTTFPGGFYCAFAYGTRVVDYSAAQWVYDPAGRSKHSWISPLAVPLHKIDRGMVVLGRKD